MARFKSFYEKVCALKAKYPQFFLSIYTDANLASLKKLTELADKKILYSSAELADLHSVVLAKSFQPDRLSVPVGLRILSSVEMLFHKKFLLATARVLEAEIFPGLKEHIQTRRELKDEASLFRSISEIHGKWKKHKRYVGYSSLALKELADKLVELNKYKDMLASDLECKLSKQLLEDLKDLADDFDRLMAKAFAELCEAMLARLMLIPAFRRRRIIPANESYNENVLHAVLIDLIAVGLPKSYVETFKLLSADTLVLKAEYVMKFRQFIESFGTTEQKDHKDDLFDLSSEKLDDDIVLPVAIEQTFVKYLQRNVLQEQEEFTEYQSNIKQCRAVLLSNVGQPENNMQILQLFADSQAEEIAKEMSEELLSLNFQSVIFSLIEPSQSQTSSLCDSDSTVDTETEQESASQFVLPFEDIMKTLADTATLLSQYGDGIFIDDAAPHTREGRASHLLEVVNMTLEVMRKNQVDGRDHEAAYCNLIIIVFLHYASIRDASSELSINLESSLINMLGVPRFAAEIYAVYASAFNARAEVGRFSRACHQFYLFAQTILPGSDVSNISEKETDLVFCFIKDLLIQHFPGIRALLFVAVDPSGQGQYIYNEEAEQKLAILKEKDQQETKFFTRVGIAKTDFDALLTAENKEQKQALKR